MLQKYQEIITVEFFLTISQIYPRRKTQFSPKNNKFSHSHSKIKLSLSLLNNFANLDKASNKLLLSGRKYQENIYVTKSRKFLATEFLLRRGGGRQGRKKASENEVKCIRKLPMFCSLEGKEAHGIVYRLAIKNISKEKLSR